MTPEERCLLIADLTRYLNRMYETDVIVGSNVWFDLAFILLPAIAMGRPACFTSRMKLVRLLRMKADLWSQLSEFIIVTETADPWFERKRMLGTSNTNMADYLVRLRAAGVPCED